MIFALLLITLAAGGLFKNLKSVNDMNDNEAFSLAESVKNNLDQSVIILMEYASWCPHCQHSAAPFAGLASQFNDPRIKFAAIDCAAFRKFCESKEYSADGYPTLRLLANGKNLPLDRSQIFGGKAAKYIYDQLHPLLGTLSFTESVGNQIEAQPAKRWAFEPNADAANSRRADAAEAVRLILRELVRDSEILDATRSGQVLNFLTVVSTTFPDAQIRADSREISKNLPPPGRKIEDFHKLLDSTKSFASRGPGNFSNCKVFSCALWQLFHILASSANLFWSTDETKSSTPSDILLFTRSTVDHFFKCEECRDHYLNDFDSSALNRPQLEELVDDENSKQSVELWLWREHNGVSNRVAISRGFKDDEGKWSLWPPACDNCNADSAILELRRNYWSPSWLNEATPMRSVGRVGFRLMA